ncbi:MAG: hypothetical protein ACK40L_10040, partial [Hydrogenophaga sp.]
DGTGSWEAMASVQGAMLTAVMSEVNAVLALAERTSPGPRGPLDDGGVWDAEVQTQADGEWTAVTLTLTGPWDWGEALLHRLEGAG